MCDTRSAQAGGGIERYRRAFELVYVPKETEPVAPLVCRLSRYGR
jgi:hypothetical protein